MKYNQLNVKDVMRYININSHIICIIIFLFCDLFLIPRAKYYQSKHTTKSILLNLNIIDFAYSTSY